jgi:maltose alpha-D-glucosyltransferase/alpha-amylase
MNAAAAKAPHLSQPWPGVLAPDAREALAQALLAYVQPRRWYRAKTRTARGARIADVIVLDEQDRTAPEGALILLEIAFEDGAPEVYVVPLLPVDAATARVLSDAKPEAIVAWLGGDEKSGLVDGLATGHSATPLLALARDGRAQAGEAGELRGEGSPELHRLVTGQPLPARVASTEQSNSTVILGDRLLLKIYRQISAPDQRRSQPRARAGALPDRASSPPVHAARPRRPALA